MKRTFLLTLFCLVGIIMANAQKFALIDMEYIMENIPAYQRANNELELASQQFQKAIEAKMKGQLDCLSATNLCYDKNISYTELYTLIFFFKKILYDYLKRMLLLLYFS